MNILPDKKLGVSDKRRAYDLPLKQDASAYFLIALIALMSTLASLALAGYLILDQASHNWIKGLENKTTIEIPDDGNNNPYEQALIIQKDIAKLDFITSATILEKNEVKGLLEPWLGKHMLSGDIPLPALISVEITDSNSKTLQILQNTITQTAQNAHLDTHEAWLDDLMNLTGTLKFSAGLTTLIITIITTIAISGAILTRMELSRHDVELLHLMGASDTYITKQFQRHAFTLSLKGTIIGISLALLVLIVISQIIQHDTSSILPTISFNSIVIFQFIILGGIICILSAMSARLTVLHALTQMP